MSKAQKTKAAKEAKKKKEEAKIAKEKYIEKMRKKGATLPRGFIKDTKANTWHNRSVNLEILFVLDSLSETLE